MKRTYKERYFDILLIVFSALFLFDGIVYFSVYLGRIVLIVISLLSLISLLVPTLDGERYSRFFVITNLIIPSAFVFIHFLTDLILYGASRTSPSQNLALVIKLTIGIILLILSLKLSRETESKRTKDYGLLSMLTGLFILVIAVTLVIESEVARFTDVKFVIRVIVGLLFMFLGFRLASDKVSFKIFVIILSGLAFVGAGTM